MGNEKLYLETDAEIAGYLGMSLLDFLSARSRGKIPDLRRPRDSTPVWWIEDVGDWVQAGRPSEKIPLGGSNNHNY